MGPHKEVPPIYSIDSDSPDPVLTAEVLTNQCAEPALSVCFLCVQTVAYLHKELQAAGFKADALHGQRSQEEREASLRGFRAGKVQVLAATDVAARGLHLRHLPYIVNYDFPSNLETYIHRVGRTGTPPPPPHPI